MNECIFGIKCNGVSISISQINIDEDQSKFDYICNVSLKNEWNGNGTYDISIINKDYIQGMPIGNWHINKASISYFWGKSCAYLIMEDKDGNETSSITAGCQSGSSKGFNVQSLARSIFTKAQEIVRDYPNAKIYNAINDLNNTKKKLYYITRYKEFLDKSDELYIFFWDSVTEEISKYLKVFNATTKLLKESEDQRSKRLLKDITSDCRTILENFKISDC